MDAVKFLKEYNRMCVYFYYNDDCGKCPASNLDSCAMDTEEPEKLVSIVEKWSNEHPERTRQSEFIKLFPHAVLASGALRIDPCDIESKLSFPCTYVDGEKNCALCRKKYWLKEIKQENEQCEE